LSLDPVNNEYLLATCYAPPDTLQLYQIQNSALNKTASLSYTTYNSLNSVKYFPGQDSYAITGFHSGVLQIVSVSASSMSTTFSYSGSAAFLSLTISSSGTVALSLDNRLHNLWVLTVSTTSIALNYLASLNSAQYYDSVTFYDSSDALITSTQGILQVTIGVSNVTTVKTYTSGLESI
jgi:hypothetical protein